MSRLVVSIGGNALGKTPKDQIETLRASLKPIVNLICEGHDVVIVHGNGPQVGMIRLAMEYAKDAGVPDMPLPECGSMSQGYIGYHIQNLLNEKLVEANLDRRAVTLITQAIVDPSDPAFNNPTKPIGRFYTRQEKESLERPGLAFVEDAGRGYRRVVPSPKPIDIIEKEAICCLVEKGFIVIAGGGGGIPVYQKNGGFEGIAAVIDKDFTSSKIAEFIGADYLFLLTAIDRVAIDFGKPSQRFIDSMSAESARRWIMEGQFAPGSMQPKVEAAIEFVQKRQSNKALIASLTKANEALLGKSGTMITA